MGEIQDALKVQMLGATVKTTEYRVEVQRDIVYEPVLEKTSYGFSLTYKDKGNWIDDNEVLHEADVELGRAEYQQAEKNGVLKWACTWFHADQPEKGMKFPCDSSTTTRDRKEVKVRIRDAKFRKLIFGSKPECLVTGETKKTS